MYIVGIDIGKNHHEASIVSPEGKQIGRSLPFEQLVIFLNGVYILLDFQVLIFFYFEFHLFHLLEHLVLLFYLSLFYLLLISNLVIDMFLFL